MAQIPPGARCSACWSAILLVVLSAAGLAQSRSGDLYGVVKGSGRALADVRVRLSCEDASQPVAETVTDASGRFRFAGLTSGSYSLYLAADGRQNRRILIEIRSDSTLYVRTTLSPLASDQAPTPIQVLDEDVWFGDQFSDFAMQQLPNGRNIWSLLQGQEASTVTNRLEIGGLEAAVPALFAALGASWTENQYQFNGLDVTDPYLPGLPLINPGIDVLSEFQAVTASKPAGSQASGENLALATPEPGGALHGGARFFGSGRTLQSDNMNARLRDLDFAGPERLNSLIEASTRLGGKLPATLASLPFFLSLSTQQVSQDLGGFAAPIDTGVNRVLTEFTPWLRGSHRLNLLYSGQHVFNSRQGAMPTVAPSSTTRGNNNFNQFHALWNQPLRPATLFSVTFGVVNAIVSSGFQNGVQGISRIDLPLLRFTGPAPLATSGLRTRYETRGILQSILYSPLGSHSLSLGFDWSRSDMTNRWYAIGDAQQVLVNSLASELIRWNTPAHAEQHVQNIAEYLQDSWRPTRWLTLPIGLRIDTSTGQANGAANSIRWSTLQPRTGFLVPLWPSGLALQGSWSRYGHFLQGRYFDFGDPAALGAQVFRWQDSNGDGAAEPSELGPLLRVSGGAYSSIDPHIARPFTDEISFGLRQSVTNHLTASIRFFRRDDHRLIGLENLGIPFFEYIPVQITDPGNDGIYGTPDDQQLKLYNERPSALARLYQPRAVEPGFHLS
ncbi:MAG TPA: carboxypeptidase regulatory-like domain-containing protein [Terriglobales bacterium]|nr:carboxypeptidase regulatory-like domain-containing protein [Terriglobales bacterium]